MAPTINGLGYQTVIDLAQELTDPVARKVVEVLDKETTLLQLLPAVRANRPDGHLVEVRSQLPEAELIARGEHISPTTPGSQIITYPMALIRAMQEAPYDVAAAKGDPREYLMKHAPAFVQALKHGIMDQLINGNRATTVKGIDGLDKWYDTLTGNLANNVINCGGATGTCTDCFYLVLGEANDGPVFLMPDTGNGGIEASEPKVALDKDAAGKKADYIYRWFTQEFGFAIPNFYNITAYRNIDMPTLRDGTSTLDLLEKLGVARFRTQAKDAPGIYLMNGSLEEQLFLAYYRGVKAGGALTEQFLDNGKVIRRIWGSQIVNCDAIPNTRTYLS